MSDFELRRKWTFRAHGRQAVFVKRPGESSQHVIMKALLWALYLPVYPDLTVEISIGDRYKPDLVMLDADQRPLFWGEAGQVSVDKIRSLTRRYRQTHFAIARWNTRLDSLADIVQRALNKVAHYADFDLIAFPADSVERFIAADGTIVIDSNAITQLRLGSGG